MIAEVRAWEEAGSAKKDFEIRRREGDARRWCRRRHPPQEVWAKGDVTTKQDPVTGAGVGGGDYAAGTSAGAASATAGAAGAMMGAGAPALALRHTRSLAASAAAPAWAFTFANCDESEAAHTRFL